MERYKEFTLYIRVISGSLISFCNTRCALLLARKLGIICRLIASPKLPNTESYIHDKPQGHSPHSPSDRLLKQARMTWRFEIKEESADEFRYWATVYWI